MAALKKLSAWLAHRDPPPAAVRPDLPAVVVVHGIHSSSADMVRLIRALRASGREVHAIDLYPANGSAALEVLAEQLAQFIQEQVPQPKAVDLVGFSMGGLVSRYYLQRLGGMRRIRRFVCLASPHGGTLLGWLDNGTGSRQMRIGSAFLKELNADAERLREVNAVCHWTLTDLVILPARNSSLPAVDNIHLWTLGHAAWLVQREAIQRVVQTLE
jgi:triacylglycerol lipase